MKKISAFMSSPSSVHLDGQGRQLIIKPRPLDTYRAARRNKAKVARRRAKDSDLA